MGLKFGGMVSLLTTIFVGPRTEAWTENDCSSSSKSNDLKTSALLYAHRCYLKVDKLQLCSMQYLLQERHILLVKDSY